jgi:hypothetical protein
MDGRGFRSRFFYFPYTSSQPPRYCLKQGIRLNRLRKIMTISRLLNQKTDKASIGFWNTAVKDAYGK